MSSTSETDHMARFFAGLTASVMLAGWAVLALGFGEEAAKLGYSEFHGILAGLALPFVVYLLGTVIIWVIER